MKVVASSSADFFTNQFEPQCGAINWCALYENDCNTTYTKGNLVIDETTGKVTAKQNVDAGWTDIVCVWCENTASSSVSFYNWQVK